MEQAPLADPSCVVCALGHPTNVARRDVRLGKLVVLQAGCGDGWEDSRFGALSHQIV